MPREVSPRLSVNLPTSDSQPSVCQTGSLSQRCQTLLVFSLWFIKAKPHINPSGTVIELDLQEFSELKKILQVEQV